MSGLEMLSKSATCAMPTMRRVMTAPAKRSTSGSSSRRNASCATWPGADNLASSTCYAVKLQQEQNQVMVFSYNSYNSYNSYKTRLHAFVLRSV